MLSFSYKLMSLIITDWHAMFHHVIGDTFKNVSCYSVTQSYVQHFQTSLVFAVFNM